MQQHELPLGQVSQERRDRPGDASPRQLELDGDREPLLMRAKERRVDADGHERVVALEALRRSLGGFP